MGNWGRVAGDGCRPADEFVPVVYDELCRLAARKLQREQQAGQILQGPALVHEAYLRIVSAKHSGGWDSPGHLFSALAEAMRRILVEAARRRNSVKHGGHLTRVDLNDAEIPLPEKDPRLTLLDETLARLASIDPPAARLVNLCFFTGLTQAQAAREIGVSLATAERLWAAARTWLLRNMQQTCSPAAAARQRLESA